MYHDPKFLLRRAKEESVKAISATDPAASEVHQKLAIRYSAKAALALANDCTSESTVGLRRGTTMAGTSTAGAR